MRAAVMSITSQRSSLQDPPNEALLIFYSSRSKRCGGASFTALSSALILAHDEDNERSLCGE